MSKRNRYLFFGSLLALFFPLKNTINGHGVIVSPHEVTIRSPFEGVVQKVHCKYGEKIDPGAVLVTLSLTGASDYDMKEKLTQNDISLEELKQKYAKIGGDSHSKNLEAIELKGKIRYLEDEDQMLTRILEAGDGGQIGYDIHSPVDGNVHLMFPKCNPGNFLQKNDDLLILEDEKAPKQLLCVMNPDKIGAIHPGDLVESVPWLNWDKGILKLSATATSKVLNRKELDSYIGDQPGLLEHLYSDEGKRKDMGAFLADDVHCEELANLPTGMQIDINVDRGIITPFFILLDLAKGFVGRNF